MNKELLSIVVLFGLILVTMILILLAINYTVVPLLIKVLIGAGVISCLIWVIVVMPRLVGVRK